MSIDPTIYLQADTIIQMPPAPPNPILASADLL
jgi:hypothetical protein